MQFSGGLFGQGTEALGFEIGEEVSCYGSHIPPSKSLFCIVSQGLFYETEHRYECVTDHSRLATELDLLNFIQFLEIDFSSSCGVFILLKPSTVYKLS
jgi:hypothetical protein